MEDNTKMNSNSRKRSRSQGPTAGNSRPKLKGLAIDLPDGAIVAQQLLDKHTRIEALNTLLQVSVSHESNYALEGEDILNAYISIVHEIFDWEPRKPVSVKDDPPLFESKRAWTEHPTKACEEWAEHCKFKLSLKCLDSEQFKIFEIILVTLRNMSFVAANLRLMAYSTGVLSILIAALYESTTSSNLGSEDDPTISLANTNTNTSHLAVHGLYTLVNLAPYLDVTGQKLLSEKLFLAQEVVATTTTKANEECPPVPNIGTFGQLTNGSWGFGGMWLAKRLDSKEDTIQDVPKAMLLDLTQDHLVWIWSIFPALAGILADCQSPRSVLLQAIDLLQEFIGHARVAVVGSIDDLDTSNTKIASPRAILVRLPKPVLERLTSLLYVPRLGQESLEYIDPVNSIVTRVTTLKLMMGYDGTVDTDIRDRVLDVLVPLLELDSPRLATEMGTVESSNGSRRPNVSLLDATFPILTTQVGRGEAPQLAAQLLRELARSEESKIGLKYLRSRIINLASKDARVAQLAMNHLYDDKSKSNDSGKITSSLLVTPSSS